MKTGYLDIQKIDIKEITWRAAFVGRHQYLIYVNTLLLLRLIINGEFHPSQRAVMHEPQERAKMVLFID